MRALRTGDAPMRAGRTLIAVALLGAALLGMITAAWLGVSRTEIGRSDFTSTQVGAILLRHGERSGLYDESLQAPLHARLIAPDREGNLPFVNPPSAALLDLPLADRDLATAYRIFSALQAALLVVAVAVAVAAAPWPARTPRGVRLATGLAALAGTGTLSLLLLGQWDGLGALGLALAYAELRSGRRARAGLWLALAAGVAKPHLLVGLAVFVAARRDRRLLLGALAGLTALAGIDLAVAGPEGCLRFVRLVGASAGRWDPARFLGTNGLAASWLGRGAAATLAGAGTGVAAYAACAILGEAWRRDGRRLEFALGGAVALSLAGSPHLLGHDLVLLAPALAWCAGALAANPAGRAWPALASRRLLAFWAALAAAAWLDLGQPSDGPPGRLVPAVLLAAGVATFAVLRSRSAGLRPAYSGRGSGVGGLVDQS